MYFGLKESKTSIKRVEIFITMHEYSDLCSASLKARNPKSQTGFETKQSYLGVKAALFASSFSLQLTRSSCREMVVTNRNSTEDFNKETDKQQKRAFSSLSRLNVVCFFLIIKAEGQGCGSSMFSAAGS